jgi:hypothetical protein
MVIKAYFDGGGNKPHETRILSLVGLAAPDSLWPMFEEAWGVVLKQHGLRWWHSSDAMSADARIKREFLLRTDALWNPVLANAAFQDLHAVIKRFWHEYSRQAIQWYTCCVDLTAYNEAKQRNPLLRSVDAIAINECLGSLVVEADAALLYFDRNEGFRKEVEQIWMKDRKKPFVKWARQVKCIEAVNSRETRPVQAADLLAWKAAVQDTPSMTPGIWRLPGWTLAYYGISEIENAYTPQRERERAERIRANRRRTRETHLLAQIEAQERERPARA